MGARQEFQGKGIPKGVDVLALSKQMLWGLLNATGLILIVLAYSSPKEFVASVNNIVVYFELKHRKFYGFGDLRFGFVKFQP